MRKLSGLEKQQNETNTHRADKQRSALATLAW